MDAAPFREAENPAKLSKSSKPVKEVLDYSLSFRLR